MKSDSLQATAINADAMNLKGMLSLQNEDLLISLSNICKNMITVQDLFQVISGLNHEPIISAAFEIVNPNV